MAASRPLLGRSLSVIGRHERPLRGRAAATAVRLEAELALGRRIQRSFIPIVPPMIPGYEVASHYEAAREVGGDFFDVFRVRGRAGRVAICIADVTGKGIAAALLMAFARPLLRSAVDTCGRRRPRSNWSTGSSSRSGGRRCSSPHCARPSSCAAGSLRLANAGHEPPLLVPADGGPIGVAGGIGAAAGGVRAARPRRAGHPAGARRSRPVLYGWRDRCPGIERASASATSGCSRRSKSARGGTASRRGRGGLRGVPPVPGGPAQRGRRHDRRPPSGATPAISPRRRHSVDRSWPPGPVDRHRPRAPASRVGLDSPRDT